MLRGIFGFGFHNFVIIVCAHKRDIHHKSSHKVFCLLKRTVATAISHPASSPHPKHPTHHQLNIFCQVSHVLQWCRRLGLLTHPANLSKFSGTPTTKPPPKTENLVRPFECKPRVYSSFFLVHTIHCGYALPIQPATRATFDICCTLKTTESHYEK